MIKKIDLFTISILIYITQLSVMTDYITKDKTIIFSPYFNKKIELGLLVQYSNVIFSDYELNDELFEYYENNNFKNFKNIYSKFNQPVNLHPQGCCSSDCTAGDCSCCTEKITHLTFGLRFNQQVNLPHNLTHLTFGFYFNQEVNLPPNLTHLTFGGCFNQKVNLPENLTYLRFGDWFNQQVNLPQNLTHLTFCYRFDQQVNLPLNVKYLNINCNNVNIIDYLPDSVEELVLGSDFNLELNDLPSSIKKLVIKNEYYMYELNCLPNNLEYLELPVEYDKEIQKYPKQLKKIKCNREYEYINKLIGFEIEFYH